MIDLFKKITLTILGPNPVNYKKKIKYLLIDTGMKWYISKIN